eukprot:6886705-Pyramimonas_sp.AAC.1
MLAARTRLKGGAAAGDDNLVAEIIKAIPWRALLLTRGGFLDIPAQRAPTPSAWRRPCFQMVRKIPIVQPLGDPR